MSAVGTENWIASVKRVQFCHPQSAVQMTDMLKIKEKLAIFPVSMASHFHHTKLPFESPSYLN